MPPPKKLTDVAASLRLKVQGWLARWAAIDGRYKKISIAVAIALTIGSGVCYYQFAPNAWAIELNGQQIAVVSSRLTIDEVLQEIISEKEAQQLQEVKITDRLDYKKVRASSQEIIDAASLKRLLQAKVNLVAEATAIAVDGKIQMVVKDEATAVAILEELKQSFLPQEPTARVQEVKFVEQVTCERVEVEAGEIISPEAALAKLKGTETLSEYTVKKGDSLWSIARAHNLLVDDILAVNPDIKGEHLDIDQKIMLSWEKPLVQVMVTYSQEVSESIPYGVKVENNANLYRGQERVIKAGVEGEQRVTYQIVTQNGAEIEKNVLAKQVIKEPENKIVERGTRLALASRGGGGSGQLAWPIRGPITSRYGYRGREFHTGLDIDGSTGDPVSAAEAGTVIFVGYSGNYGRMVTIDHGDGLVTRYAHLNGYNVSTGDQVERGQIIGYVGTSGRTTGSHLHFEVRVNGSPRDPLSYLD
ncbi:MAG: M23 family metallopeptidase [Clostridia bacterium]|nr:M23 family metallopeptidase [Clostridia bacterium]